MATKRKPNCTYEDSKNHQDAFPVGLYVSRYD
jgi:hypothetical protein